MGDVEGTVLRLMGGIPGLVGETSLVVGPVVEICSCCWEGEKDCCHCRRSWDSIRRVGSGAWIA